MNVPSIYNSCLLCKVYIHVMFIYASLLWGFTYWLFHPWHSRYFFHHDDDYVSLAHSNMNVDNAAWQKKKQFFAKGYAERMPFFDKPTLGAQCRSDLWCPERWRIWGRFHRSELAGHPAILKLSDFTGNPVLRCLQPTKHGDFSRTIQVPRFLWNEATPLYPIVYDHPNPAMGQTQNRRSLP